jgi:hypothetical protein
MGVVDEQALVTRMYERLDAVSAELAAELDGRPPADRAAQLRGRLASLREAEHGLVFGRIEHRDGTSLPIGRRGLWVDGEPLLVDWRAPAAAPFYAATAAHPMGLRRRRHLRLAGRRVTGVADEILDGSAPRPDDVLGDGPLAEALAAPRTGRMGDAVTTLQAEQDAIVRSPHRGITVVQGGPGTGKTVVALHRAAYLLFAFPAAAERGVLVVGPDARFLDYISQVLPSLGENDVRLATRTGITGGTATATEPIEVARLKGRAVVAEHLADRVGGRRPAAAPITLPAGNELIEVDETAVAEALAAARGMPHNPGRAAFREYLVAELARRVARRTAATLEQIDAETVALTGMDLDAAVAADLRALGLAGDAPAAGCAAPADGGRNNTAAGITQPDAVPADDTAPAPGATAPAERRRIQRHRAGQDDGVSGTTAPVGAAAADLGEVADLPGLRAALRADSRLDAAIERLWPRLTPDEVVTGLLAEPPAALRELRRAPGSAWTPADLALLDEAAALVDDVPEVYGHVVVDEAQELTEMDWRVVLRRCPSRSMTVVGDFAQAGRGSTVTGWREAVGTRFELHTLTVNYRTTAEILAYSRELLARIAPAQQAGRSLRHGEPPRVATDLAAEVAAHAGDLIAVICPDRMAEQIATRLGVRSRAATTSPADGAVVVVPAGSCRGLEFDTVLVVAPAEIGENPRDLYVALTRATHRLVLVEHG